MGPALYLLAAMDLALSLWLGAVPTLVVAPWLVTARKLVVASRLALALMATHPGLLVPELTHAFALPPPTQRLHPPTQTINDPRSVLHALVHNMFGDDVRNTSLSCSHASQQSVSIPFRHEAWYISPNLTSDGALLR